MRDVYIALALAIVCTLGFYAWQYRDYAAILYIVQVSEADKARENTISDVATAWSKEDYTALETMYSTYIETKSVTPSGIRDIANFYKGFDTLFEAGGQSGEGFWTQNHNRLMAWNKAYPKSTAPIMIQAQSDIKEAWAARGTGYSLTVSAKGWQVFTEKLNSAHTLLVKARHVSKKDPQWYALLFTVALGKKFTPGQITPFMDEAAQRHPGFIRNFYAAQGYYYPQWFGDVDSLDQIINRLSGLAPEGDRDMIYAQMYALAAVDVWGNKLFSESRADWPRMKKGFEALVARYPDPWNLNYYARFACMRGDKDATTAMMKKMGRYMIRDAWGYYTPMMARCSDWAVGTDYLKTMTPKFGDISQLEETEQWHAVGQTASASFITGDYDTIERMAQSMTQARKRFPGGMLQIEAFYGGIDKVMDDFRIGDAEQGWIEMQERADAWLAKHPQSFAARLVHARSTLQFANSFRGPGSRPDHPLPPATDEGRAKMAAAITMLEKDLENIRPVVGSSAEWYILMLNVAYEQRWPLEKYNALLKEALDADATNYDLYNTALRHLTRYWPKNNMDTATQIELLARDAARRTAAEHGDAFYANIYRILRGSMNFGNGIFQNTYASWPRVKKGFEDMMARYPGSNLLNGYGVFACLAGDMETTQAVLARIRTPDPGAWVPMSLYTECSQWAGNNRPL